ncbi:hypothetical protein EUGRSUZ_E01279 [Eucalyptus grandis]|uniref:Uncharacterized protein n=2 Tax=Eucalyptus grandis TaxID=71139 RepID=A0ACC3KUD9_EUCGR|nr:hypothetical protein EUGRSUZ_E01279 [Eucalyptus grandis]
MRECSMAEKKRDRGAASAGLLPSKQIKESKRREGETDKRRAASVDAASRGQQIAWELCCVDLLSGVLRWGTKIGGRRGSLGFR